MPRKPVLAIEVCVPIFWPARIYVVAISFDRIGQLLKADPV
jgi:hypothetical protein